MLPDKCHTFYAHFNLLNMESAVKSNVYPEDWLLSLPTADIRQMLRVNIRNAAAPGNISGHVIKMCKLVFTYHSHTTISILHCHHPPCTQKSLLCLVKMSSTIVCGTHHYFNYML